MAGDRDPPFSPVTVPAAASGRLQGRHAVITGAAGGIGAAIARALAAEGAALTLMGRRLEPLAALCNELPGSRHGALTVDVTDEASVTAAFDRASVERGAVDILVNNAGQAESAPFGRTSLELWNRMMAVNLTGTFLCSRAVLPGMLKAGGGRIVNVASTAGQKGYAYVSAYVAAKHGVVGLTRSLALEVACKGVTVNAVCPGYTDTELLRSSIALVVGKTGRTEEEALAEFAASNPQGRIVQPREVASTVHWLCLPESASINGQSISVSGGEVM